MEEKYITTKLGEKIRGIIRDTLKRPKFASSQKQGGGFGGKGVGGKEFTAEDAESIN